MTPRFCLLMLSVGKERGGGGRRSVLKVFSDCYYFSFSSVNKLSLYSFKF